MRTLLVRGVVLLVRWRLSQCVSVGDNLQIRLPGSLAGSKAVCPYWQTARLPEWRDEDYVLLLRRLRMWNPVRAAKAIPSSTTDPGSGTAEAALITVWIEVLSMYPTRPSEKPAVSRP